MTTTKPSPTDPVKGYARADKLVSTEWLAAHLDDPTLRILESDEDVLLYDMGHIPGAQKIDWHADLNDVVTRDYVDAARFQQLMRMRGIDTDTPVILYGDKSNWWATYALWVFELFGLTNVRILDGGRMKWEAEGRPMVTDVPKFAPTGYIAPKRDDARIRAFIEDMRVFQRAGGAMIDVRSEPEYTGERTHMPDYPEEGTLRGGHIPGARNVPWSRAANSDGTFKSAAELRAIYEGEAGLAAGREIVTYCRIGERSSHTWFVLTYLLGYRHVRNYDGSWTEWGNAVRTPIRRGSKP